jgi:hypothetical protein
MIKKHNLLKIFIMVLALPVLIFAIYNLHLYYGLNIARYGNRTIFVETNFSQVELNAVGLHPKGTGVLMGGFRDEIEQADIIYSIGRGDREIYISNFKNQKFDSFKSYRLNGSTLRLISGEIGKTYIFDLQVKDRKVYISYVNYYNNKDTCDSFYILSLDIESETRGLTNPNIVWKGKPCLHTTAWQWHGFSGRMVIDNRYIYMAGGLIISDIYSNLYPNPNDTQQSKSLSEESAKNEIFGSIIRIDKRSGDSTVFATGFRSPGGFFKDEVTGNLWVTDHGPRGGDELNLVIQGKDYGWPYVSFGGPYQSDHIKNERAIPTLYRSHDGYEAPIFYWTPSIGPSQLIVLEDDFDGENSWTKGDLIVGSLKSKSLYHIKLGNNFAIKSIEEILIGHRIRSLQWVGKYIYMSTDDGQIIRLRFINTRVTQGTFPPIDERSALSDKQGKTQLLFTKIVDRINNKMTNAIRYIHEQILDMSGSH